jgi:16S rRNA processing protein RimM
MIEIAKILKPQGIKGEIKVQLFSGNFEDFCSRGFAYLKQGGSYRKIIYSGFRVEPPFVFLRITGIESRDEAESVKGEILYISRDELPANEEGEYYIFELIGMNVVDSQGNILGNIKEVMQHGAADIYSVEGIRNFMFPALKKVIKTVELKKGIMTVDERALSEVAVYDDV